MSTSPATILIVDDDPDVRTILSHWLDQQGYTTRTCDGGRAGLAALEEGLVDVILLDVMMPEMDGLQVCAALQEREEWRSIPVILLTARDDMPTRARGMALGVSEFLTKPVGKTELLNRIQAQVRSGQLNRKLGEAVASLPGDDA